MTLTLGHIRELYRQATTQVAFRGTVTGGKVLGEDEEVKQALAIEELRDHAVEIVGFLLGELTDTDPRQPAIPDPRPVIAEDESQDTILWPPPDPFVPEE